MKKPIIFITVFLLFFAFLALTAQGQKNERTRVKLSTPYGDMVIALSNKTPLHRDNFVKLVKNDFYDSLLFHRIIEGFMIQGGDPDSRTAGKNERLGNGGPGYRIPAELDSTLFHQKGAVAAARQGDKVNPEKKSSGSQFYIVQGRVLRPVVLDQMEKKFTHRRIKQLMNAYLQNPNNREQKEKMDSLQKAQQYKKLNTEYKKVEAQIKKSPDYTPFKFSKAQREAYTTVGGTPHLDGNYTVFGQVIKGMHVIDSIAAQPRDKHDRPLEDIPMEMELIK